MYNAIAQNKNAIAEVSFLIDLEKAFEKVRIKTVWELILIKTIKSLYSSVH